jgi:hypothetical protein
MTRDYDDIADGGPSRTSGMAVASLVLGVLSFCASALTGLPAVILGVISLISIKNSNGRVGGTGLAVAGLVTGVVGSLAGLGVSALLIGLLLPAVQRVREAAVRVQSGNNMKEIAVGMHIYAGANGGSLPPAAITGKDGKPLLSWRVALLPYVMGAPVYQQFKLDEPWDSPHNKPLLSMRPRVYAHPAATDGDPTTTYYQVFVGKKTAFEPGRQIKFGLDFPDGMPNTILIAEAANPVPWTKPDDLPFDPDGPLPPVGGLLAGGWQVATADGAVRMIDLKKVSQQTLRAAITRNGNDPLGPDW